MGGAHLDSPGSGGSKVCLVAAPQHKARAVVRPPSSTPGTVQMAPVATTAAAGRVVVVAGLPGHDLRRQAKEKMEQPALLAPRRRCPWTARAEGTQISAMLPRIDIGFSRGEKFRSRTLLHGRSERAARTGYIIYMYLQSRSTCHPHPLMLRKGESPVPSVMARVSRPAGMDVWRSPRLR